jgi:hypothetical protein
MHTTNSGSDNHNNGGDRDRYVIREVISSRIHDDRKYKKTSKAIDRKRGIEVAYNQIFKHDANVDTVTLMKEIEIL